MAKKGTENGKTKSWLVSPNSDSSQAFKISESLRATKRWLAIEWLSHQRRKRSPAPQLNETPRKRTISA